MSELLLLRIIAWPLCLVVQKKPVTELFAGGVPGKKCAPGPERLYLRKSFRSDRTSTRYASA